MVFAYWKLHSAAHLCRLATRSLAAAGVKEARHAEDYLRIPDFSLPAEADENGVVWIIRQLVLDGDHFRVDRFPECTSGFGNADVRVRARAVEILRVFVTVYADDADMFDRNDWRGANAPAWESAVDVSAPLREPYNVGLVATYERELMGRLGVLAFKKNLVPMEFLVPPPASPGAFMCGVHRARAERGVR